MTMIRDELTGAFMLLTRLPVGRLARRDVPAGDCVWAWPVAGAAVGALGGAALWIGRAIGLPPVVATLWAIGATVLASGALHEDGLADTADGFGGGRTRERKLAIMRDSRIGGYGALALGLALAIRVAAIAQHTDPRRAATALFCACVAGRGGMLLPLLLLRPARSEGLAAPLAAMPRARAGAGLAITAWLAFLPGGLAALAGAAVAALIVARVARRQIGGYTGDVLGATEQLCECAALSAMLIGSA